MLSKPNSPRLINRARRSPAGYARTACAFAMLCALASACGGGGESSPAEMSEAQEARLADVPVYYFGDAETAAALRAKSVDARNATLGMDIGVQHVLVFDSAWLATQGEAEASLARDMMKKSVLAGNPVIAIGETTIAKGLIDGQIDPGRPAGSAADQPATESAFGYYSLSDSTATYGSDEADASLATENAVTWARQILAARAPGAGGTAETLRAGRPYFNDAPNFQRSWSSGTKFGGGKINISTAYTKLQNDNNNTFDWWKVDVKWQVVPNAAAGYRTADMQSTMKKKYAGPLDLLETKPTTTEGSIGTVSPSISFAAGGVSVSAFGSSYTVTDAPVYDKSDWGANIASWWHNVNEYKSVGKFSYSVSNLAVFRIDNGRGNIWDNLIDCYDVRWAKDNGTRSFPLTGYDRQCWNNG